MMLSLEQKVGQMMYVGFDGLEPPAYILEWLAAGRIGGVYLFARNVASPQQVADLVQACHAAAPSPILVGIDQEGGLVARLRAGEGFTESPGLMTLAASDDVALARQMSEVLAQEMHVLGINWVFAPVVDIVHDINNPSVSTRSAGIDKDRVARFAVAQIEGFQKHVAATAKHFPGLGKSAIDTHLALAHIDDSVDYIRDNDLVPFRVAVDASVASVMTTHTLFTQLDDQYPATLSPSVLNTLLRQELNYTGVVSTDCLEMKAIADHYGPGESAILAALAGVDTIMFSHTRAYQEEAYEAVLKAVESGRISEEQVIDPAVKRIAAMKARYAVPYSSDLSVIRSQAHLTVAQTAARAGTVLLREDPSIFPLTRLASDARPALIEFPSYLDSEVIEQTGRTGFANLLAAELPEISHLSLRSENPDDPRVDDAIALMDSADVTILVTRSLHLYQGEQALVKRLRPHANKLILVCLRNPYDVDVIPDADVMVCTLGDSTPSMIAAVDALLGKFSPSGQLPIHVNVVAS